MKTKKFKVLHILMAFFTAAFCLALLSGCSNEDEQQPYVSNFQMTGEEFVEIMEQHGAFVTDMSVINESFAGIFIATDSDTHPMEMDLSRDYSYLIIFNSSDNQDDIEEEYLYIMEMLRREDKLMSEHSEENGIIRYEFISERLGYNLIVRAGNVLIQADGPEASRNLINSLISALGL
ncbi:MAG: hypothetical protein FWE29_04740 [Defluviitaleaceae bacterium]|nr:hypothetical protein [Defluviitaleaceae bacterium]